MIIVQAFQLRLTLAMSAFRIDKFSAGRTMDTVEQFFSNSIRRT